MAEAAKLRASAAGSNESDAKTTRPVQAVISPTTIQSAHRFQRARCCPLTVGADKPATGGGIYLTAQPRLLASGDRYYADVHLQSTGAVRLVLGRAIGTAETALQAVTVSGLPQVEDHRLVVEALERFLNR